MGKVVLNAKNIPPQLLAKLRSAAGVEVETATDIIEKQMAADDAKAKGERWKVMQDTQRKTHDMANETYINRVKTSDKQQKAVLDFVKG